jgi:hypothetical protein
MRLVGLRREPTLTIHVSGTQLAIGARLSETLSVLVPTTFIPKGVYRYACHQESNQHQQECLARGMGQLELQRRQGP